MNESNVNVAARPGAGVTLPNTETSASKLAGASVTAVQMNVMSQTLTSGYNAVRHVTLHLSDFLTSSVDRLLSKVSSVSFSPLWLQMTFIRSHVCAPVTLLSNTELDGEGSWEKSNPSSLPLVLFSFFTSLYS